MMPMNLFCRLHLSTQEFGPNGPSLKDPFPSPQTTWTKEELQLERDAYDGSIAYLDQQLGLLYNKCNNMEN